MSAVSENNKRIAKNTAVLYLRTIFTLLVSLFTSRLILNVLGIDNFGIYNVVGGFVSMFSVMSSTFSAAIGRFITYELGRGDEDKLKNIFSTSLNIQICMALFIFVIGAILGSWFLNNKMSIPVERIYAANWVLYCSLISFCLNLLSIPYNACIIAHEKMTAFAYISILETILKLLIVYLLYISPVDILITYSILFLLVSIIIRYVYIIYCKKNFTECEYRPKIDKKLFREMAGFAGWNFFGNTAYMFNTQGVNMLMNVFFGVTVNAARGVAVQVQNAILQFVNNFTTAINPQITKKYAEGDTETLFTLICQGAKYSYFLLLIFTVPIFVESDYVLKLWLGNVPEYSSIFLKLILLGSYTTILGNTGYTAIMATGNIRNYQVSVTVIGCMVFPITWLFYYFGFSVTSTYYIYIVIYFILNFVRIYYMKVLMNFPPMLFINKVMIPVIFVSLPVYLIPYILLDLFESSFIRLAFICIVCTLTSIISIYIIGLSKKEKSFVIKILLNKIKKN